tara:strand:- start:42221 stop:43147 length:927 start_codon:yes stop_codon:yes gene_type:complete
MPAPAIEISGLTKSYGSITALKGVNIKINQGEFYGLLGPNGAGKTTTINILTGLVFPDKGSALVFGRDIISDYRFTRSKIGISAQEISIDWFFPIERLLFFQAGYYGITPKKAKPKIEELLIRLGLEKKRNSRLRQLSGGMKRRFQLAKALVHDPEIIILDEPTAGVDVELRRDLWEYLRNLHRLGKTILLTTHYIEEAEMLCENVAIIDGGEILRLGAPKKLIQEMGKSTVTISLASNINNLEKYLSGFEYTASDNQLNFNVKNIDSSLPKIIEKLTRANIPIKSIKTSKSTLEDVFLSLTGKNLNQ